MNKSGDCMWLSGFMWLIGSMWLSGFMWLKVGKSRGKIGQSGEKRRKACGEKRVVKNAEKWGKVGKSGGKSGEKWEKW